jgi:type I restriction enzyme S subunit
MSFKESLFGIIPSDWELCEIGDVADLKQGLQISKKLRLGSNEEGSIPLLKITDLPSKNFSEFVRDIPSNYIADKGDIIYTRTGQVGLVYTDVKGCVHNNCFKVIFDYDKFDKYYAFYYLNSNQVRSYSNSVASGSVQKDLTHTAFKKCLFPYPQLKEQRAIAKILRSLDEKIETNNQINKKLEEMAQSIFKQWFVDFELPNEDREPYKSSGGEMIESELGMIPKGWKVGTVGNLCDITSSKRIFMKEYSDNGIPFYRSKEIIEKSKGNDISTELFISKERYAKIKEKFGVPSKNDILLTSVGTLGVSYLVGDEEFYFKDGNLTWFKDFKNKYFNIYIYNFLISLEGKKAIDSIAIGSTQKALTINSLKQIKIIEPSTNIINKFHELCNSIIEEIRINIKEKERLIEIRDTLLPKLMSGEIRVPLDNQI